MSKIIRAIDRGQAAHFNFDDVTAQASACITQARAEAARLLAEAADEAAVLRQNAEADGRAAAAREFDQQVEARVADRIALVKAGLEKSGAEMARVQQDWLARWEQGAVRLATSIARRVIRRELSAQPEIPLALVREALQLAAGSTRMRLLMNPADVNGLAGKIQKVLDEHHSSVPTKLVADASIAPGGCRVETEHGAIDQQFEAQLARIVEELI